MSCRSTLFLADVSAQTQTMTLTTIASCRGEESLTRGTKRMRVLFFAASKAKRELHAAVDTRKISQ